MAIQDTLGQASQIGEPDPDAAPGIPPRKSLPQIQMSAAIGRQQLGAPSNLDELAQMSKELDKLVPQPKEHIWSGTGKALAAWTADLGAQVAGAAEYGASRIYGPNDSLTGVFHQARQGAQNLEQSEMQRMTPEEQDEMARQWTTLDPHQTIWQGGPSQFVHSVVLKAAQAAPATVATIWPVGRMVRAGMTNGALAYIGATQAGLSVGQIANNISDDIMNADENKLRQDSPKYAQYLSQGMDPGAARQKLVEDAQRYAPVVGGLVSGAISTMAGRFLTPVLSKEGARLGARVAGGALDQAIQGGGTAATDYVARETAAHTYDNTRAPDFAGAAAAGTEGAVSGAITGAGFGAFSGHGPREEVSSNQNPGEIHRTMEGTSDGKATGAAPEAHTSGPGAQNTDDYVPRERNVGEPDTQLGETPDMVERVRPEVGPRTNLTSQRDMFGQGIDPALVAVMDARRGRDNPDADYRGAQPQPPASEEPPWASQMAIAQRNGQLDFQGTGQMNPPRPGPTPPANVPGQLNLPFQERQRGVGRQPMQPAVDRPAEYTREDNPQTVADALRARVAGFTKDENQPDLFNDQNPRQVQVQDGRVLPGQEPLLRGNADNPTAEPFGDIQAQLRDLQDPQHERGGVYLSADNIDRLRRDGLLDQIRQSAGEQAVPLVNFDGKGGTLIAKDQAHADMYSHYRDQRVGSMQEILGDATGAGHGKPETGAYTVQQHDDQGNVTRETATETLQEAQHLAQQYNDVTRGRTAQVLSTPAAILRRAQLIGLEREHIERERAQKGVSRAVSDSVDRNVFGGEDVAQRARSAANRDILSGENSPARTPEEAARRITAESQRTFNEIRKRAIGGAIHPDDLVFRTHGDEGEYRRLYSGLTDTISRRDTATDEATKAHAQAGINASETQIQAFLRTRKPETKAEEIARSALQVSREGVENFARDRRAPGRTYVEPIPRFDTAVVKGGERPTRADVHAMSEEELRRTYNYVLDKSANSSLARHTADEMREEDQDVRSKMEKRINRFFRKESKAAEIGNAKSQGFAVSPRRALTERAQQLNASKAGTRAKRLIGYKTFEPEALMHTVPSQREMEGGRLNRQQILALRNMSREERKTARAGMLAENAKVDQAKRVQEVNNLMDAIKSGQKHHDQVIKLARNEMKSGDLPQLGAQYLREILQYGRALRDQGLRSTEARSAAKKFVTLMDALGRKNPVARAQYLIDTYKTERERQLRAGAAANPIRLEHVEENGYDIKEAKENTGPVEKPAPMTPAEAAARNEAILNRKPSQYILPLGEKPQTGLGYRGRERVMPFSEENENELRALFAEKYRPRPGQMDLPLNNPRQPKPLTGYKGRQEAKRLSLMEEGELRDLLQKVPDVERNTPPAPEQGQLFAEQNREKDDLDAESKEYLRSALGYPQKPTAFDNAARVVADHLESDDRLPKRASTLFPKLLSNLQEGTPMHKLFTALQRVVDPNTIVGYAGENRFSSKNTLGHVDWTESGPVVRVNRDALEGIRADGQNPSFNFIHTIAHEFTHVATSRAIEANPAVRERLTAIMELARRAEGADGYYGLRGGNVHEMVAEAYSNPRFQRFLDSIQVHGVKRSLWERFKNVVADIIGFKSDPKTFTALDAIMREHGTIFRGKQYATTVGEIKRLGMQNLERDPDGKHVGNGFDRLIKSVKLDKVVNNRLVEDATKGTGQFGLSAMTPRQQRAQFGKYFAREDGSNPYERYWDTFFQRSADNAKSMEKVGKISNTWSNLEELHGIDTAHAVSKLMHDATLYQFHPDLPLNDELNEHLTSPEQKQRQADGQKIYDALPTDWQDHYQDVKNYYAREQQNSSDQIVLNGLHAMLTKGEDATMTAKQFDAKYDAATVRRLGLDTEEGLRKEFGEKLSGASVETLTKIGTLSKRNGPYFPLMRNGDYIVTAERKLGAKSFDSSKEAQAYAAAQRAKDSTLTVSVRADDDGGYRVATSEKEVRMAESKSEAAQHRKELATQYGDENVSPVQLKADLYKQENSIPTGSALDKILNKLDDNPAAQNAIKEYYLRSLGDQSFRKRELTRSNRRGVDIENQHRSFTQYGRSQSYYLSQLKYGRHLANAQAEVNATVKGHTDESQVSAIRMGEFAKELALRDEISRNPYKVSDIVKKGTSLTQFLMLTSPSHWFVRAAQPYVLSAPWLGARHGFSDSVAALGRAQSMIADPLLKETVNSGLGLKALFSRASAEKSYSVIDDVLGHIRKSAGADASKIEAMVQHLRDNNLIDLSMATELSDIAKGKDTGLAARVIDASRIMLHLCEVNNRVMTAIAARELGLKSGMTEAQAVEHAANAIDVTHNDYSYGNTPRLFMAQAKGILGGARPLMFQFMKYPQQVYGMMISSGLAALKGKTPQERQTGVKTLAGVLATHLLAAGAVGATVQPIKWAFGALMAGASAIGATDEPYTVANALSGDTYDHMLRGVMNDLFGTEMGELLSKGLPTAVGVDLSQRMALGSLYSFHLKTDSDASTVGSLLEAVGGPWLNVLESTYDAGKKFMSGDVAGAAENMSPHLIRDLIKAGMMTQQGVVDNQGRTLIPADKLSGGEIFAQSLGFRPDQVSETLSRNSAERNAESNIMDQKKGLLQKLASAEPPDRDEVRSQIKEFNMKHPGFAIDGSAQMKAIAARAQQERELQQYGVRARAKQLPELTNAGGAYNVQ